MHGAPAAWRLVAVAFGIAAGQLAFVLVAGWLQPGRPPKATDESVFGVYAALHQWDSGWYDDIAGNGYRPPDPAVPDDLGGVAFFPGFPFAARGLHAATGLPVHFALIVVGQLGGWATWAYLLLLLRDGGVSRRGSAAAVGVLLCHPAAYYFVAAYSESLFLAGFLGMCFWAARPGWPAFWLAAAHGLVMTGTRIVGVPVVIVPVLAVMLAPGFRRRDAVRPAAVAALSSLGCLAFFAWCHARFGRWDLYAATQADGWNVVPNYAFPLETKVYLFPSNPLRDVINIPFLLDPIAATACVYAVAAAAVAELPLYWRGDRGLRRRLPWHFAAGAIVYVTLAAHFPRNFGSVTRHSLVAALPFMLLCADAMKAWRWRWATAVPVAGAAAAGLAFQVRNIQCYVTGINTY